MIPFKNRRGILSIHKHKEYHLFNFLIATSILIMTLYLKTETFVIQCPYSQVGMKCETCGLTRSFKKIINGSFEKIDREHFLFFILLILQLIIRPLISFLLLFSEKSSSIRNLDVIMSLILIGMVFNELILK